MGTDGGEAMKVQSDILSLIVDSHERWFGTVMLVRPCLAMGSSQLLRSADNTCVPPNAAAYHATPYACPPALW